MVNLNPTDPSTVQILPSDIEPKKGKKRLFSEIQAPKEEEPPTKKIKVAESDDDPAYEALKTKEVGWVARLAIKTCAHQGINSLVTAGKIKKDDPTFKRLNNMVDASPAKTYEDLEKIGIEVISCLYEHDAERKEKEVKKIQSLLVIYDTEGIKGVWSAVTNKSNK
jgi:hypothetical protein